MLSQKVTQPAQTELAAPIVFMLKKDGSLRFCEHYGKLNAVTKRDLYVTTRMDEWMDSLGEAVVFFYPWLQQWYWQVELEETDRNKSEFISDYGPYRFVQMPFGLKRILGNFNAHWMLSYSK